jgi:hypothetical protein
VWESLRDLLIEATKIRRQLYRCTVTLLLGAVGIAVMVVPTEGPRLPLMLAGGFIVFVAAYIQVRTSDIHRMRP